jgi:hypothetical protein
MEQGAHVLIATPAYNGSVTVAYLESIIKAVTHLPQNGIRLSVSTVSTESLITRARNYQTAIFMGDPQFTHMIFVDADIGFDPQSIVDLVNSDFDVCACPYPRKTYNFAKFKTSAKTDVGDCMSYVLNISKNTDGKSYDVPVYKDHYVEVEETGTGFLMVKKKVIQKMMDAYPESKHHLDVTTDVAGTECYGLFDTMIEPETRRYLSDDYAFCRRWKDMGGNIFLNTEYNLTHSGIHTFSGNFLNSVSS